MNKDPKIADFDNLLPRAGFLNINNSKIQKPT